jgi:DNA-binding NtrC family response regulator
VAASPRNATAETILVVDDNIAVRRVAARILEQAGYTVIQARGASDALDTARTFEGEIHLLLTDIVMPGMNGTDLAPRMLAQRTATAVVYMSGYADVSAPDPATSDSVRFLAKPFTPHALLDIVRQALDDRSRRTTCTHQAGFGNPLAGRANR